MRIRSTEAPGVLTFKGPKSVVGGVRSREEIETVVEDVSALSTVLARLGLVPAFRYEKYREVVALEAGWRSSSTRLPIGVFLEIEGDEEGIHEAATALGFTPADFIARPTWGSFSLGGGSGRHAVSMRAMILAAGLGERMRPLSAVRAKPALPVLNRPLLHRTLEQLVRHGIREVVINTHHLPETIHEAVGTGRRWGVRVTWSDETTILGTGGGLRQARAALGDGPVLVVNGDVVFDFDLTRLVERHRSSGALVTLGLRANPDPSVYLPIVTRAQARSSGFRASSRLRCRERRGCSPASRSSRPGSSMRLSEGFSDSIRDLSAPLVREDQALVLGVPLKGAWYDLGRPALYLRAQLALLRREGRGTEPLVHPAARLGRGCRIERSVLGAGVVVGEGTLIESSVLWEGVRVGKGARVRSSILARGARVADGALVEKKVVVGEEEVDLR